MGGKFRRRNVVIALTLTGAVLAASALSGGLLAQGAQTTNTRVARATLVDGAGQTVGTVRFERRGTSRALRVTVTARKLSPGFHGFHVHTTGKCDGPTFMTAGPHLNPAASGHPGHAGDMPPLLATSGGKAEARFTTDRFSLAALRDADGSAVMVHALPDNHSNIPTDRYDPDPDTMTLATGRLRRPHRVRPRAIAAIAGDLPTHPLPRGRLGCSAPRRPPAVMPGPDSRRAARTATGAQPHLVTAGRSGGRAADAP